MLKSWLGRYLLKVNDKDTRTMFIGDFELIFASRIVGLVSEIYFNRFQWNLKLKKKKTFTTKSPGIPGTQFINLGRLKGCRPWSHPVFSNQGSLDQESSVLTIRPLLTKRGCCCFCVFLVAINQYGTNVSFLSVCSGSRDWNKGDLGTKWVKPFTDNVENCSNILWKSCGLNTARILSMFDHFSTICMRGLIKSLLTFTCSKSNLFKHKKHSKKVWHMFKLNNKNTRTASLTSF